MGSRFKDFDAAWAGSESAPLTVKVYGKKYDLPAKLPAKVVIIIARLKASGTDPNADVPLDKLVDLLEPFFGDGTLNSWLEAGIDIDQLGDVFRWAMSMYNGNDPDEPDAESDEEPSDPKD